MIGTKLCAEIADVEIYMVGERSNSVEVIWKWMVERLEVRIQT